MSGPDSEGQGIAGLAWDHPTMCALQHVGMVLPQVVYDCSFTIEDQVPAAAEEGSVDTGLCESNGDSVCCAVSEHGIGGSTACNVLCQWGNDGNTTVPGLEWYRHDESTPGIVLRLHQCGKGGDATCPVFSQCGNDGCSPNVAPDQLSCEIGDSAGCLVQGQCVDDGCAPSIALYGRLSSAACPDRDQHRQDTNTATNHQCGLQLHQCGQVGDTTNLARDQLRHDSDSTVISQCVYDGDTGTTARDRCKCNCNAIYPVLDQCVNDSNIETSVLDHCVNENSFPTTVVDQHKSMLDLAKEVGCSPLAGQSPAVTLNDGFIAPPDPDNEGTVRICVNGVTVDSTEDFPRDGLDGDDGVVRRRRPPGQLLTSAEDDVRRRSWCPDSPRMYGGSHGQEVMDSLQNRSLAMAGKR